MSSSFFFVGKLRQLPTAFMEQRAQILMLAMTFWPANNIKKSANNIKNQQLIMSKTSHQINGSLPINSSES
jgi:nucleoside recognition membrane protein YjiH